MESHERSGAPDALNTSATGGAGVEVSESPLFASPTDFIASLFPLVVLAVCVSAISSSSAPSSGFSLLHPASLFNALRLHLTVLRHHAPIRCFSSATISPPFILSVVLPCCSFFVLRLLPLLGGSPHGPLPALAFSVSYSSLFSLPAAAALNPTRPYSDAHASAPPSSSHAVLGAITYLGSLVGLHHFEHTTAPGARVTAAGRAAGEAAEVAEDTLSLECLSPLLRLLLHPAYLSRRSVVFWLAGGPLLLYSCILHIYLHHRDVALTSTAAPAASATRESSARAAVRLFVNTPKPALRATVGVAVCFFLPSVLAAAALRWLADPGKGTQQSFQYVGVEGAIYALTFLVALYDPVTHSGMFSNARLQYMGPFHVREVTALLAFVMFLFTPPPFDLYLLLGGIVAAGLAAAAASAPPLLTLFSCTAAAALLHPALFSQPGSILPTPPWSSNDTRTWSAGGLALTVTIAAVFAGVFWNWSRVVRAAEQSINQTHRTRGRLVGLLVLFLFLVVPFSYAKAPSLQELLLRPRRTVWTHGGRSLYDITCNGTTALGSVAAKVIAYWLPLFALQGSNDRLKYIIGPLLCFLLFIGMEMERWENVGPHIIFPLVSLYLLFTLKRD